MNKFKWQIRMEGNNLRQRRHRQPIMKLQSFSFIRTEKCFQLSQVTLIILNVFEKKLSNKYQKKTFDIRHFFFFVHSL